MEDTNGFATFVGGCIVTLRPRPAVFPIVLAVALTATACDRQPPGTGGAAGDPAGVTIRDSANIEIVENHAPVWPEGRFWTLEPEREIVLGREASADGGVGDSAHLVWDVRGAVRLADGRVATLSRESRELFIFEPSGALSRSIGRRGRGPGEFSYPENLQYLPGDTLVVWDTPYGPVSYFDTAGSLLRHRSIDLGKVMAAIGSGKTTEWLTPLGDGSFVAYVRGPGGSDRSSPPPDPLRRSRAEYVRIDSAYAPHSFGWWGHAEYMPVEFAPEQFPGATLPLFRLFFIESHLVGGHDPPRVHISNGDQNEIHQFSPEGPLLRIVRRTTPPLPITREEREAMKEQAIALGGDDHGRQTQARMLEALPPQDFHPYVNALRVDTKGYLWVADKAGPKGGQWSVFDSNGRWLGTLPVPLWTVHWIEEDLILGVNVDGESGIERVEGYRLNRLTR